MEKGSPRFFYIIEKAANRQLDFLDRRGDIAIIDKTLFFRKIKIIL